MWIWRAVWLSGWFGLAALWSGPGVSAEEARPPVEAVAAAEPVPTVAGRELAGWVADLESEQRVVRLRAVRSLAPFGSAAGEPLRGVLESEDPAVRYLAAIDLGRLGGEPLEASVERLKSLRDDPHPAVQMAAAFALCRSGNREGNLDLLVERLDDPERAMACSAAQLLEQLDPLPEEAAAAVREAKQREWDAIEARQFAEAEEGSEGEGRGGTETLGGEPSASPAVDPTDQFLFRRPQSQPLQAGKDHPNVLWMVATDLSPELGCYGDAEARTPHLDQLASEGLRFDRAHAPAGTGAVVRSGMFTGVSPLSLGSQNEPSRIVPPHEVRHAGELFRAAGYYCTHRGVGALPFENPSTAWDRQGSEHADWRERDQATQPFFAVVELSGSEPIGPIDPIEPPTAEPPTAEPPAAAPPADGDVPLLYAATAEERGQWARYRARVARIDRQVGELLERLAEDGLEEHTLVVFTSVSGRGLPGGSVWLVESATRIPLIVRWPAALPGGRVRKDLVSLLDLLPTMLAAAGLREPQSLGGDQSPRESSLLQGRRLLVERSAAEPAYLFFHRDRVRGDVDLQRAARDRRWKYLRNYEPSKPYTAHPWLSRKPIEELYDCQKDPEEAENLAERPQYAERLGRMRRATEQWQQEVGDQGLVPEAVLMHEQRPGGRFERTAPPVIRRSGSTVLMYCTTDGAAIAYRTRSEGEWSRWRLYVDGLKLDETERVEAKAVRMGYRESKIARN
ncbi:sulfatase-like hydrolase/transferase [Candidatus Laterigemmans baculatus]|uniref:sulfatase-like hydrolase/transferase n=1 Tax=Candidatus Laterigemmans baculatus TaxID=2770505 RepID=UPI0013DB29E2|nr:sulfatase-like hydrolase/transferase [Candidatus Laterigemmans baculatus]